VVVLVTGRGLLIGKGSHGPEDGFRVVAIDPDLNTVEIEDSGGTVLVDTIEHFTASHPPALQLAEDIVAATA
jgi:hypothetical protein